MKIANISAEIAPFSKTGGLGEVTKALPSALCSLGNTVVSITPLHKHTDRSGLTKEGFFRVTHYSDIIELSYWKKELPCGVIYFIEHERYFTQPESIYSTGFDNERFFVFCLAALELLKHINFKAEIIQCHDWHTGLIPYLLKYTFKKDDFFADMATVFTIHNLAFQLEKNWWQVQGDCRDDGYRDIPKLGDRRLGCVNFALRGISSADIISTVSENYAKEILTKEFGENLDRELHARKNDIFGIINGIDTEMYNPATDPGLAARYDADHVGQKYVNKKALQKYFGLAERADVPILGMVSRITEQKGIDLIIAVLDSLLAQDVQVVIMGIGDKDYERIFSETFMPRYPNFSFKSFDRDKETLVYAGSDLYLMPSRFEPCGLCQLIGLRYGVIPVVRRVGGLADTIQDFDENIERGAGFVFDVYDAPALMRAIARGLGHYRDPAVWQSLVTRAMKKSFSWEIPAERYIELFKEAVKRKNSSRRVKTS
jgi:starch synthase